MKRTPEQEALLAATPGYILRTEFMEPHGISQAELARRTGVPASRWTPIFQGRRAITPETALALGFFWGMDPRFWLNLQATYDLRRTELEKAAIIRARVEPLKRAG